MIPHPPPRQTWTLILIFIPEVEENHLRTTLCQHCTDKDRIAEGTERYTEIVPKVLRKLEKALAYKCIISERNYFEGDQYNIVE